MDFSNKTLKNTRSYKVSSPKAWEFANDKEALKLDWNESTIEPSPKVFESIKNTFTKNKWNWYPNINNTQLIKSISDYCKVAEHNIQYFASSDCLHEYIVRCFVEEKDRILSITPTYDNFRAVAEANGASVFNYSLNPNFILDYEKFQNDLKLIKPKICYIVNPNNPTGTLHNSEDLIKLVLHNKEILFIVDEAYYEFSGQTLAEFVDKCDNLIISRTFSKAFGLASFRIGYTISNKSIINTLNKIRNPKNVSLFAQEAALAALADLDYLDSYVQQINLSKDIFCSFLSKKKWIKHFKGSGNFIFMEIKGNLKSELIIFLETNKVFVRDYGHIKQTEDYMRITVGTEMQMKKVMDLINLFENKI